MPIHSRGDSPFRVGTGCDAVGRVAVGDSRLAVFLAIAMCAGIVCGQDRTSTSPTVGLRRAPSSPVVLANARVVTEPGEVIERASVVIEGRSIRAVLGPLSEQNGDGEADRESAEKPDADAESRHVDSRYPAGAEVIDCEGKTIYAGLIDAWGEVDVDRPDAELGHWNRYVTPERSSRSAAVGLPSSATKLRSQGITARLVAPEGGIIKGTSCVALLGDPDETRRLIAEDIFTHLQLTVPRGSSRSTYPNSPMGAVALLRQTFSDANWYRDAWHAYQTQPGVDRPESNRALRVLGEAMREGRFVADAPNERMAIRADGIAKEFALNLVLRGSGQEYQRLEEILAASRAVLLPVDFPEPPNVSTPARDREVSLRDLTHWHLAPENPARLVESGLTVCLTTDGLRDPADFLSRVRQAIDRGLSSRDALAAVTTNPAELLGVSSVVGRVRPGMLANLVLADGDLFGEKTKVLETWVAGERFPVTSDPLPDFDDVVGRWTVGLRLGETERTLDVELTRKGKTLEGTARLVASDVASAGDPNSEDEPDAADDTESESEKVEVKEAKLTSLIRQRDRLTASIELRSLDDSFPAGTSRMTWVTVVSDGDRPRVIGTLVDPAGNVVALDVRPGDDADSESDSDSSGEGAAGGEAEADASETDQPSGDGTKADESDEDDDVAPDRPESPDGASAPTEITVRYPLGAYGVSGLPQRPVAVLFRGATVWTCGEAGKLDGGEVLVVDGKIAAVGERVDAPEGCRVIDVTGKHITPGLIDCHSHMATDGGVNESAQAVTAEVRIGDFIDNSDIEIYRQLAGGLTIANILHGSANPIGGQNQVIKLRWGGSMDELRMRDAPAGIKFALGENVKRNTSRYPNTRMGVEQIIRDQMLAAREYAATWRRWEAGERDGLPPRRDLQLEAIVEIQRGDRWIHCHSYRQDEIVATLDVLEEFGIQIGTLQHILEGYKVAERMARHGAMASAFSDWWAYKFEVYDAIPYNGVLMHDAGLTVSYNSDDRELARHLNTEAAKAVKYGGVPPEEALRFVTTNPAKQLRIDDRVGSIEQGKDADLVVWSGRPLSTTTRCEQTWIDGRRYFDLETDRQMRQRDAALHTRLTQMVIDGPEFVVPGGDTDVDADGNGDVKGPDSAGLETVREEDRWLRYDEFCNALGSREATREDRR